MISTFFNGLNVLYHHAKFGEDRTMRVSCMCKNMVFCVFLALSRSESGPLFVRGDIFEQVLRCGLWVNLDAVSPYFP